MAESVAIVSKGSQANNNRNEMNNQTDDPIKMNGTLKSTTTSTVTPDSLANKLSHSNGAPSVMQINDIGFDLEQLFALSLKFFKNYEGKAFHASYDDRNKIVALGWQVKFGPATPEKGPQIGALDIVGRDRRQAWTELGKMSKEGAIQRYVEIVNQLCHLYRPFIEAHWREMVDKERLEREEAEKRRVEEKRLREEEEKKRKTREEVEKFDEQKRIIQEALNKQTYTQFVAYAKKAYPNSVQDQERLIKHLQEKHYEQYMQQVMQQRHLNSSSNMSAAAPDSAPLSTGIITAPLDQQSLANNHVHLSTVDEKLSSQVDPIDSQFQQLDLTNPIPNGSLNEPEGEHSSGDEELNVSGSSSGGVAAIPRIWTKDDVISFKEAIKKEGGSDGVVKVGHGEIVTIRVPTHPEGSCLFWEFCTDDYDIGFGLLFEWTEEPGSNICVQVQDSGSEDDDDASESSPSETASSPGSGLSRGGDVEKGTTKMKFDSSESSSKKYKSEFNLPTTVIVPIYRRESHEHVFAGSHVYPGKGVYLLKFDNSYSLWRSKTLYYRVYYTR